MARLALPLATLATLVFAAAPSLAGQPAPDGAAPVTAPREPVSDPQMPPALPPSSPAPAPSATAEPATMPSSGSADRANDGSSKPVDTRRGEGVRLALDLGFERAVDGAVDRLNANTPTLLPIGLDVSFRTSPSILLGVHGYAALASRDDCISADSCRGRGYGFGAHIESPLSRSQSFVPYIRYGMGYELVYQGGAPLDPGGHLFRGAFDMLDLRLGGDFIVSHGSEGKTARLGGFLGFTGGFLVSQSGVSHLNGSGGSPRDLDRSSGSPHLWFAMGVRGSLDP